MHPPRGHRTVASTIGCGSKLSVSGTADRVATPLLDVAELGHVNVEADPVRKALDDPARTASNVEDATRTAQQLHDDAVSFPLPVPLQEDSAVERSIVVVGPFGPIPQPPQHEEGPDQPPSKFENPCFGHSLHPGAVMERDFVHFKSHAVNFDEDLLQRFEMGAGDVDLIQHALVIEAETAGEIEDGQRESLSEPKVEDSA